MKNNRQPHDSSLSMEDMPCRRCNKETKHLITEFFRGGKEIKCTECKKTKKLKGGIG